MRHRRGTSLTALGTGGLRLTALLLLLAPPVSAQSLRSRFNDLFIFGDCGVPLCLSGSDPIHASHFVPVVQGQTNVITQGLLTSLESSIVTSVSNIPAAVGSGGASITFVGGLPVTTPVSPGPILGERGTTLGRHRVLLGVSVTGGRFDRLRGVPLGAVQLHFVHEDVGNPGLGDPTFENDLITVTPDFHFTLLAASFSASYGLTRSVEVGVIVPVLHATLQGRSIGVITCDVSCLHYFGTPANPQLQDTTEVDGSASGLGDVSLRTKVALWSGGRWAMATVVEARLPTGNEQDLLGAGHLGVRVLGVASASWGTFTAHANAGYFARGGSGLNDAVLATIGFDGLLTPGLTVAADLASQWQVGTEPFSLSGSAHYIAPFVRDQPLSNVPNHRDDRLDLAFGLKISNRRGLTGLADIYLPLRSAGLQAPVVWTLGGQYDF